MMEEITKEDIIISARRLYVEDDPPNVDRIIFSEIETDLGVELGTINSLFPHIKLQYLIDKIGETTSLLNPWNISKEQDNRNMGLQISNTFIAQKKVVKISDTTQNIWDNRVRIDVDDTYYKYEQLMFEIYVPDSELFRLTGSVDVFTVQPAFLWDNDYKWIQAESEVSIKSDKFKQGKQEFQNFWKTTVYFELKNVKKKEEEEEKKKNVVMVAKKWVTKSSQLVTEEGGLGLSQLDALKALILMIKLGNSFRSSEVYMTNIGFANNSIEFEK
jgi:hypothetical protein